MYILVDAYFKYSKIFCSDSPNDPFGIINENIVKIKNALSTRKGRIYLQYGKGNSTLLYKNYLKNEVNKMKNIKIDVEEKLDDK